MNKKFERINENGPEVYRYPALDALGVKTFVSGRGGGVSPAPFDSLNVSVKVGDAEENVAENFRRIKETAGIDKLYTPIQVHGAEIVVIDSQNLPKPVEADAVILTVPNVAIGVKTADCVPILLVEPVKRVSAAIHAGRASTELGIVRKTAEMMVNKFNCDPTKIRAALGPSIRQCCYEVDETTARNFHDCCGGGGGRYLDLIGVNKQQLTEAGIDTQNITDSEICTSCESERFYSHRKGEGNAGRFVSGIAIKRD